MVPRTHRVHFDYILLVRWGLHNHPTCSSTLGDMDADKIKSIIEGTVQSLTQVVSEAVKGKEAHDRLCSSSSVSASERIDIADNQPPKKRAKACPLPSRFLRKSKKEQSQSSVKHWTKDIICLPKKSDGLEILIPRGSSRSALAGKGLIGKLALSSYMDEQEIRELICEVFQGAFGGDKQFLFKFLQCVGGGSKFLTTPCTTGAFEWNAKEIISAAGKRSHLHYCSKEIGHTQSGC